MQIDYSGQKKKKYKYIGLNIQILVNKFLGWNLVWKARG